MRIHPIILIVVLLMASIGITSGFPPIPAEYYGTVTINGAPAPVGTTVAAFIDGYECGSITTATTGAYGGSENFQNRLIVQGRDTDSGKTITFRVNGVVAGETAIFSPGVSQSRDVTTVIETNTNAPTTSEENTHDLQVSGLELTTPASGSASSAVVSITDLETGGSHVGVTGSTVTITTGSYTLTMPSSDEIIEDNNNGTLSFTPQSIQIETKPVTANVNSVGEVTATVQADLTSIPAGAAITTSISSQPTSAVSSSFQLAATGSNLKIDDVAYTLNVVRDHIEDGTNIASATISMSVSPEWVAAHGGISGIRIIRTGEDGTNEVLETTFAGYDSAGRLKFTGLSPHGLSTFGLVTTTSTVSTSSSTEGSYSSSGSNAGSGFTSSYYSPSPSTKPGLPRTFLGTGTLVMTGNGNLPSTTLASTTTVIAEGSVAALTLEKGITVKDSAGNPVTGISITPLLATDINLQPSAGITYTGYAYECSPDGTVFSPSATIVFFIPKEKWGTLNPEQLTVRQYNPRSASWEPVNSRVNSATKSVTAPLTHFSRVGLFEVVSPVKGTVAPKNTVASTGSSPTQPNPVQGITGHKEAAPPLFSPLIIAIVAIVVIIAGVAGVQVYRRRTIDAITLEPYYSNKLNRNRGYHANAGTDCSPVVIETPTIDGNFKIDAGNPKGSNIVATSFGSMLETDPKSVPADVAHLIAELDILKVDLQHKDEVIEELRKERDWLREQVMKLHEIMSQNKKG